MDPDFVLARYYRRAALAYCGREAQALAHYDAESTQGEYTQQAAAVAGYAAARLGERDRAMRLLAEIRDERRFPYVSAFNVAHVLVGLGAVEEAHATLERGIAERDPWAVFILANPAFADLPRIEALRASVGAQTGLPTFASKD